MFPQNLHSLGVVRSSHIHIYKSTDFGQILEKDVCYHSSVVSFHLCAIPLII